LPIPEALRTQADAYPPALAIFLAPIVGLTEHLGVYRVHGQNLFAQPAKISRARQKLRIQSRRAFVTGIKSWLWERGWDPQRADLYAFLKQRDLVQEEGEFLLEPPGRLRTSRHLIEYAWFYGPQMTWRHCTVTFLKAACSPLVGYENVHRLDEWRAAVKSVVRRPAKPYVGSLPA
jgi:hypothetical protein